METQHNLSRVLAFVEAGNQVGIKRQNQLVARIIPAEDSKALPDFVARAQKIWGGKWKGVPSDALVDEARGSVELVFRYGSLSEALRG
ncbi:MAG: hypothetical protein SH807_03280 [Blastochloris sp.]|nr:hypothetical protein [Blastochloris sp.]